MKFSIVAVSSFVGLFLGTSIGVASAAEKTTDDVVIDEVLIFSEATITAHAPKNIAKKPVRQYICSEYHDNGIGGRNRDCSWK